jgi:hypothetical protein
MQSEQSRELKAVHTTDLSGIFEKLGLSENFNQGKIICNFCHDVITLENIGSLKKLSGEIIFTCNKSTCYNELIKTDKKISLKD